MLTQTASYTLADLTLTTDINKNITTQIGVKNLFDVTDVNNNTVTVSNTSHSGAKELPLGYGRSFFLGLSFQWTKK